MMESQIETMRGNIAALKSTKPPKEKKKKDKRDKPPIASSSKAASKSNKAAKKKNSKKLITENDVLTFEQKKDLSESIAKLDDTKLEKVIQIIHEGVPEIRDVSPMSKFIIFLLISFTSSEYGRNRTRNRPTSSLGFDQTVQFRDPSHACTSDETKPCRERYRDWRLEAKEYG